MQFQQGYKLKMRNAQSYTMGFYLEQRLDELYVAMGSRSEIYDCYWHEASACDDEINFARWAARSGVPWAPCGQ